MDPFTGAGAFATIIGLICNFKSERSGTDVQSFLEWLKEKQQEDTVRAIEDNAALSLQLSYILATNHDELLNRLDNLDLQIATIAGQTPVFVDLARTLRPESSLSKQAISILEQLVSSGAKMFMEQKFFNGSPDAYNLMDGGHGKIQYNEPQFIEDDLQQLLSSKLLQLEHGSKGSRKFLITRAASKMIHGQV
ncbi:hypothetical protein ACVBKF_01320 [Shewanella sp. 0m-11]